jgi:hypothetical protein
MTTRADQYLQKAAQFEQMAKSAHAATAKAAYQHLAWSYRQLGTHVSRGFQTVADLDGLAKRSAGGTKTPL